MIKDFFNDYPNLNRYYETLLEIPPLPFLDKDSQMAIKECCLDKQKVREAFSHLESALNFDYLNRKVHFEQFKKELGL